MTCWTERTTGNFVYLAKLRNLHIWNCMHIEKGFNYVVNEKWNICQNMLDLDFYIVFSYLVNSPSILIWFKYFHRLNCVSKVDEFHFAVPWEAIRTFHRLAIDRRRRPCRVVHSKTTTKGTTTGVGPRPRCPRRRSRTSRPRVDRLRRRKRRAARRARPPPPQLPAAEPTCWSISTRARVGNRPRRGRPAQPKKRPGICWTVNCHFENLGKLHRYYYPLPPSTCNIANLSQSPSSLPVVLFSILLPASPSHPKFFSMWIFIHSGICLL